MAIALAVSDLGDKVRAARKLLGLTQADLAKKSGLSQSAVSQVERGERVDVRHETVSALESALGVSLATSSYPHVRESLAQYLASDIGAARRLTKVEIQDLEDTSWFLPGEHPTVDDWDEYVKLRRRVKGTR